MTDPKEIIALETSFWQAMVDGDAAAAAAMITEHAANIAMFGIVHFSPAQYIEMAENGPARTLSFKFSDEKVFFPTPDVAVITYTVEQSFSINGKPQDMTCYDSTVWVCGDAGWRAALHTESRKEELPG